MRWFENSNFSRKIPLSIDKFDGKSFEKDSKISFFPAKADGRTAWLISATHRVYIYTYDLIRASETKETVKTNCKPREIIVRTHISNGARVNCVFTFIIERVCGCVGCVIELNYTQSTRLLIYLFAKCAMCVSHAIHSAMIYFSLK